MFDNGGKLTVVKVAFPPKARAPIAVVWQGWFTASQDDRYEEQMTLIDQPGPEGVGGERRTPDEDVMRIMQTGRFQLSNRFRIERLLKLRFASGDSLQRLGVHDFVRRLPDVAKSLVRSDCAARAASVSQTAIVSYMRRP